MLELDIQMFADGKIVISTELDTKNFQKGIDTMQNKAKSGGTSIKNIVAGLGITKLIGTAFSTITSNIDGAVKRIDTLNNFPKVMSNLGIGANEAQKSIEKMSDKLMGLPTTLDAGAMAVQRFTSKNGDVAKSTDMFLALNNALLAGGASTEIQSSAMEQLSQAYAKGRPDMMEWRSMLTAMPAQATQLGKAFGMSSDELGEALRKGDISMDEFMEKVMELNEKGVDGFQNFEQQARNSTGGLQTTIANAKNAVVRGVAALITSLDEGLKKAGFGGLSNVIDKLGKGFEKILKSLTPYIEQFLIKLREIYDWIQKNQEVLKTIAVVVGAFIATFKTIETIIGIINGVKTAIALLNAVMLANPIGLIVAAIAALVAGFIYLWKTSDDFRNFWKGVWEGIKNIVSTVVEGIKNFFTKTIPDTINSFIDFFKNFPYNIGVIIGLVIGHFVNWIKRLGEFATNDIPKFIEAVVKWFKELPNKIWTWLVNTAVKLALWIIDMKNKASIGIKEVANKIIEGFKNLPNNIAKVGKNIVEGLWNGIKNAGKWIKDKVGDFAKGVLDGMKKSLGIHSPSTVFRDEVGKMIAQGVGVGFTQELDNVFKDMQNAVDLETDKMSANVQTSGTYQVAMKGNPTFNLKDNSTNQTQLVVNGRVLAEVVNTENRNREVAKA